ncbi:MAG: xanthine dehydrogenase family protein molybdopterin-binding subunit [Vicinamibacterales bacterium]
MPEFKVNPSEFKLIGKNYQTPDLVAKVTGRAKYAEDYRADGMVFCKLVLSPMPHARVRKIDTSQAEKLEGFLGILTADELPPPPAPPQGAPAPPPGPGPEFALTNEPVYEGEPVIAVAAVDETTAAEAIERIRIDYEPLPFIVDPIDSLRPSGPNARTEGNVFTPQGMKTIKWTAADIASIEDGKFPTGAEAGETLMIGDVDAGFKEADLILEEPYTQQSTSHQPLETRTSMAYWQNGKLYLHGSTQSVAQTLPNVARWVGIKEEDVVVVSEYTGGGFGSKIPGVVTMAIPALLSKKLNRPVMMRVSREEETYIGRVRPGFQGSCKIGFKKDGRITAMDLFIIEASGPYRRQGDNATAATVSSLLYTPPNIRFRGLSVATNTPPPTSQRAPGGLQGQVMTEPLMSKAARNLGIDQVAIRKMNAPETGALFGLTDTKERPRQKVTSAFVKEALDKGAAMFGWEERKGRSGQRKGSKVTGVGVAAGTFTAGSIGFDGLISIRPDGRLYVQQGIGNLGTESVIDTARVVAEMLNFPWEKTEVVWGNTGKHVPWSSVQAGSQTIHAHTRANHAAAMDAKAKLQEIAAKDLGGKPEDYDVGGERVFRKGSPGVGLTFAKAAERAIALGGKFDGHEVPENINAMTKRAAAGLAGLGLMGVARDAYGRDGATMGFSVGYAEVEVDVETGVYRLVDYVGVADVGTVIHPRALGGQIHGGAVQGFGHVRSQKLAYDTAYGVNLTTRVHQNKPPTILDIPHVAEMRWAAVEMPDPQTPIGAKGIGEPAISAGAAALLCALADAMGDDLIRRTPVTPEMVMTALEAGKRTHLPFKQFI